MADGTKRAGRERAAELRAAQQRADRRRRRLLIVGGALALALVATGITVAATHHGKSKASSTASTGLGPEGMALETGEALAGLETAATGKTVDGIPCQASEQVAYHIHAHLAVYVGAALRPVPLGIGIVAPQLQQSVQGPFAGATRCYYWLHVHAQDGVIHVESPTNALYTLGQFFAIWGQPLSATRVGPATGPVTVYVDGKPFSGNPADIPLKAHEAIQLDVGPGGPPATAVDWSKSKL